MDGGPVTGRLGRRGRNDRRLVKSGPNQIETKLDHDPRIFKVDLKPGTKVPCKVEERIWVDYTAQRVGSVSVCSS